MAKRSTVRRRTAKCKEAWAIIRRTAARASSLLGRWERCIGNHGSDDPKCQLLGRAIDRENAKNLIASKRATKVCGSSFRTWYQTYPQTFEPLEGTRKRSRRRR